LSNDEVEIMKGEDKIFLLQVINAVRSGGNEMAKFLLDGGNVDRVLRIRNEVGQDALDRELIKLREVVYEDHQVIPKTR
jgi:hypothetical protein